MEVGDGYGYGYILGALPRGRCARSVAGFADTSTYSLWAGVCGQPPDTATGGGVWCVCPGRELARAAEAAPAA